MLFEKLFKDTVIFFRFLADFERQLLTSLRVCHQQNTIGVK